MGKNAFHRWNAPVNGNNRNAGLDGLLQSRRHGVDLVRADDDALDALGDRRFNIGGLLGRGHLTVALDHVIALLHDFRLEGVHHVDKEREAEARYRGQDLICGIGGGCRHYAQRKCAGYN